jgi:hypothetical protein
VSPVARVSAGWVQRAWRAVHSGAEQLSVGAKVPCQVVTEGARVNVPPVAVRRWHAHKTLPRLHNKHTHTHTQIIITINNDQQIFIISHGEIISRSC